MHDGIYLETCGVPAAVVCSDVFAPGANLTARLEGLPGYRYVTVPHPLGRLSEDELLERVLSAVPQVERILLGQEGE